MILAASCWGADRLKKWREASRPLPPPPSPNVLLIVLDTVGADHLSLFGYNRPTSPTIDELATRGICFDPGAGDLVVDSAIACKHVYRTMAP